MSTAIHIENVSKTYTLGAAAADTFGGAILGRLRGLTKRAPKAAPFHALKDISLEVKAGEVLGLIGHNGAGKSTLLKILSRITTPSAGRVTMRGRVASLLEVGSGFHPELTGRENVFLNGTLLGMSRAEVATRFDEIVDFAGVEQFIDTAVKHYSSGMYMRLAFAVAAHLEPEILLIDEVLAVGDAEFQKKSLGKMDDVAKSGRTVVFVSHNLGAVQRLCSRAVLLRNGELHNSGSSSDVVAAYLHDTGDADGHYRAAPTGKTASVTSVKARVDGHCSGRVDASHPLEVEIVFEVTQPVEYIRAGFAIRSPVGSVLFEGFDAEEQIHQVAVQPGIYRTKGTLPPGILKPGPHTIDVILDAPNIAVYGSKLGVLRIDVIDSSRDDTHFGVRARGLIRPQIVWSRVACR